VVIARSQRERSTIQVVVASGTMLFAAAAALRAVMHLTATHQGIFDAAWSNYLLFISGFLHLLTNGVGFVLLVQEDMERELRRLTQLDPLTGLYNRRAFLEQARDTRALCRRLGQSLTLLLADLDHFKQVNDTMGHAAGDTVLRRVTATIRDQLRVVDVPARIGGEEFAVLLPSTDATAALVAAERLRLRVAASGNSETPITISIGITELRDDESLTTAMARADRALYAAKEAGRNRIEIA
jgi:diguanylate cyclase (GGDEF)-like protein